MEGLIFLKLALFLMTEVYGMQTELCDRKLPRLFSTRTAYDEVRHTEVKVEEVSGCRVKTFYTLNRHGTRYPGADEIKDMASILPSLRDKIVANSRKGLLCAKQVAALKQWIPVFDPELGLQNTPIGLQEMEDLGERWRSRFPSFFGNSSSFTEDARCGDFPRLRQSATHFHKGLFQRPEPRSCESVVQAKDNLLFYLDNCARYIASRISPDDPEKLHAAQYDESPQVANTLQRISRRLGVEPKAITLKIASIMYEACRFEYAVYRYAPWCDVFGTEDLQTFVYRHDMKYYWRYGHGRDINYLPSCLLLTDIISTLKNSLSLDENTQHITTRMGSSRSILPLLVRFGLFQDTAHLHTNNSQHQINRQWHLGLINPFASNLVLVHYDCDTGHKIRTFLNERSISLGRCHTDWCRADVFLEQFSQIVNQCEYDSICNHPSVSLVDYRYDMHHL